MRCKNCGADNDDNRYICEVCGSPLYDESDFDNANGIDDDRTQTFKAVNEPNNQIQNRNDNYNDYDKENQYNNQYNNQKNNESEKKNKGAEKKSIIVIAVLVPGSVAHCCRLCGYSYCNHCFCCSNCS